MDKDIENAVAEFHAIFLPKVRVRYIGEGNNRIAFFFRGRFCLSCGLSDYFDDLAFILNMHSGKTWIVEDMYPIDNGMFGWIVIYKGEYK